MSLYKGSTLISGVNTNTIANAHFLFEAIWSDHVINHISFLRADTFSWQDAGVYSLAYNTLVNEYNEGTEETEGSITFRRSSNGYKIATSDYESAILSKYNTDGIAWYYILDTTNKRFKLPRTKWGFKGLRDNVGDDIDESLPNITGNVQYINGLNTGNYYEGINSWTGVFKTSSNDTSSLSVKPSEGTGASTYDDNAGIINFNANSSSSTYQDGAPVQERATQMYLYFYVGEYSQTAIEQTAGITSEQLNNKVDKTGDTMTGGLNFNLTSDNKPIIINMDNTTGSAGENLQDIDFRLSNTRIGMIRCSHYTAGDNALQLYLYDNDGNSKAIFGMTYQSSSGKVTYNRPQLITAYVNGTSGYNIWSNGYCEQWGRFTCGSSTGSASTISFTKTFANTNYNVMIQCGQVGSSGWQYANTSEVYSLNVSSMSIRISTVSAQSTYWRASGYLASGQY